MTKEKCHVLQCDAESLGEWTPIALLYVTPDAVSVMVMFPMRVCDRCRQEASEIGDWLNLQTFDQLADTMVAHGRPRPRFDLSELHWTTIPAELLRALTIKH